MSKSSNAEATKQTILEMSELVAEYANRYGTTKERAVLDIMKVDSRFQGSFNDTEIATILGVERHKIVVSLSKATRILSAPNNARTLLLYSSMKMSNHGSDF